MNREGTLHIVRTSRTPDVPELQRYQVGFADYTSPGGAMRMKQIVGEQALRVFFDSIGVEPDIGEKAIVGLRTEGSANVLSVLLSEETLVKQGLAEAKDKKLFSVRFTVFQEVTGYVLAYSVAGPFISPSFASKAGSRFPDLPTLIRAIDDVGLPGREIVNQIGKTYSVTSSQLTTLGLKPPAS